MATSAADWVSETGQYLYSGSPVKINKLSGAISSSATTLTYLYGSNGIGEGSIVAIDTEVLYVWETNPLSKTVTVERGYAGSTPAAHSDGVVMELNPNFTKFAILRALNQEIASLNDEHLFAIDTVELTFNPVVFAYDLTGVTGLDSIYAVEYRSTGLTNDWRRVRHWSLLRDANLADFPSGLALSVSSGESGQPLRVLYEPTFRGLADLAGSVDATLIPASAWDIPVLGAAARLVAGREVGRNDTSTQGDTRRSTEVPPGAIANSSKYLLGLRNARVAEVCSAVRRRYPVLSTYR